jgi:hypothetical protein
MDETSMQNDYATEKGYFPAMAPTEREQAGCFSSKN